MALSDWVVKQAKTTGKAYTLPDIDGLSLAVTPAGCKSWHFRYYWLGKQQRMLPDSALTYDPVKDFTGIAKVSSAALVLVVRIARQPEYKEFCDKQGMSTDLMDHASFHADLPREQEKWKRLVALANAK